MRSIAAGLLVVLVGCLATVPANATAPGINGRLLINQLMTGIMWTANPDGSDFKLVLRIPDSSGAPLEVAAVSPDGSRIAYFEHTEGRWSLVASKFDGSEPRTLATPERQSELLAWSPDGTRLAFTEGGFVAVVPADGGAAPAPLAEGQDPTWSPDGTRIAFARDGLGGPTIWTMNVDGSAQHDTGIAGTEPDWSPDGSSFAFIRPNSTTIWRAQVDGSGQQRLTPFDDRFIHPAWSPDGTRIAFSSTLNGTSYMAWTMNADGSDMRKVTPFESVSSEQVQWAACPSLCATAPPPPACTSDCLRTAQLPQPSERPLGEELFAFGSFTDAADHAISITADNAVGTFHDDGDGQWSWSATPRSPVGPGTITVTARSSSGDTATEQFDFKADSAAPAIYLNRHDDQGCSIYLDVMTAGGSVLDVDPGDGRPFPSLRGGGGFGLQYLPGTYTMTLSTHIGEEAGVSRTFTVSHTTDDCLYAVQQPSDASGRIGQSMTVTGAFAGGAPPIYVYADANPGTLTDHGDGTWTWTYTPTAASEPQFVRVRGYSPAGEVVESFRFDVVGDTIPPTISCDQPDGRWHAANVAVHCVAADTDSGLAEPADASFTLTTSVPAGAETSNATTGSHQVCDREGNCATAGPIAGNMVDRRAPAIDLRVPADGATYSARTTRLRPVSVSYSCDDGGSGVSTCAGTQPNGATLPTGPHQFGRHTFTVTATDAVGNTATATSAYTVTP